MSIKNRIKLYLAIISCSVLAACASSTSVLAAPSLGNAAKKMTAYAAKDCYNNASETITLDSYAGATANTDNGWVGIFGGTISNPIYVPTATGSSVKSYTSCAALVNDGMGKSLTPYRDSMSASDFGKVMSNIGYKADSTSGEVTFTIPTTSGEGITVACSGVTADGKKTASTTCGSPKGPITITYRNGQFTASGCANVDTSGLWATCKSETTKKVTVGSSTIQSSLEELVNQMGTGSNYCDVVKNDSNRSCVQFSSNRVSSSGIASASYTKGTSSKEYMNYIGAPSDLKLTKSEQEGLAYAYLTNYYNIQYYGKCGENTSSQASAAISEGYTPANFGNGICYVKPGKNANEVVPGWTTDGTPTGLQMSYDNLVKLFSDATSSNMIDGTQQCKDNAKNRIAALQKELDYNKTMTDERRQEIKSQIAKIQEMQNNNTLWKQNSDGSITCNVPTASGGSSSTVYDPNDRDEALADAEQAENSDNSNTNDGTSVCFGSAGVLGWIVCPVIQILGDAVSGIYQVIEKDFIQIDSEYMTTNGAAHQAWTAFRNFANIIFAVAFIIVILSQITGIGLSNYNIKKMLPRLIVVVVMVNISFFLCQVAVDLSNILGYSLENFFTNLASDFDEGTMSVGGIVSGILGTLFGVAGVVGAGAALAATWEFWLIPLILAFVSTLIGVIFFFIVLAVRKAGILLLVALTPVAIVCYALPNTKPLFDKWRKIFVGLLVVYPICGMLMGGGKWLSGLMISGASGADDAGFFMMLTAMLLQVVPFFFIPGIVRSSMSAMGNIGNRISNFGNNLGRQATNSFRRSELARNMQHGIDAAAYNSVGALGRSRAGQFIANSRLGKFVGGTRVGKWAGERRATSQAVRKSRLAGRYNFIEKERMKAAAATGNQLLTPGSEAYDDEMRNLTKAQQKLDVASQEAAYENGINTDKAITALGADESWVDINNEDSLIREYDIQMRQLQNEVSSKADYTKTLNKVKALQNILSKTDSGRNAIQNNMLKMANNQAANGTMAAEGSTSALSLAASHLSAEHIGTYKQGNRGMFKMIQDFAGKKYSHIGSTGDIKSVATGATDSFGQAKTEYRSQYYGKTGLAGYTAESLANADDGALNRMISGVAAGEISGTDMQAISNLANEALAANAKGTLQIKEENKAQLQKLAQGSYAVGAVASGQTDINGNVIGSTAGSQAMSNASMASLEFINSGIQNGTIRGDEATKIAENARAALQDPAVVHDSERAEMLNQILTTASNQGVSRLETVAPFNPDAPGAYHYQVSANNKVQAVDSASIKVRGAAKPPKLEMQKIPNGWTLRNPNPGIIGSNKVWQKEVSPGTWVNLNADELKTVNAINRANRDRQRQNAINGYDVEVPTPPPAPSSQP